MGRPPRFIVDELALVSSSETVDSDLEALALKIVRLREHGVVKASWIWNASASGKQLWQYLFDGSSSVDPEVRKLLVNALQRTVDWDDDMPNQDHGEAQRPGAGSRELAASRTLRGTSTGLVSGYLRGLHPIMVSNAASTSATIANVRYIHYDDVATFFRELIEIDNLSEASFLENAEWAFPSLRFDTHLNFSLFNEEYRSVRAKVATHLAVLNDHALTLFAELREPRRIAATLLALGVDASPENGNTKANRKAMAQRTIVLNGESLVLDWHTKIRPHIDRIYFRSSAKEIVIGLFHHHLD